MVTKKSRLTIISSEEVITFSDLSNTSWSARYKRIDTGNFLIFSHLKRICTHKNITYRFPFLDICKKWRRPDHVLCHQHYSIPSLYSFLYLIRKNAAIKAAIISVAACANHKRMRQISPLYKPPLHMQQPRLRIFLYTNMITFIITTTDIGYSLKIDNCK